MKAARRAKRKRRMNLTRKSDALANSMVVARAFLVSQRCTAAIAPACARQPPCIRARNPLRALLGRHIPHSYYIKVKTPDARKAMVKMGKAYAKKSVGQTLTASERPLNHDSGAMPGFVN